MDEAPGSADRQIARSAGIVMVGFAVSNLVGLARQIIVSRTFGTSSDLDALYAANRLPDLLFNLMAGGALASAYVPSLTGLLARRDREAAWRLTSAIANLLALVLTGLAAAAWLASPWLVGRLFPFDESGQSALTASLLRLLLPTTILFGLSGLLMGTLNAHRHFSSPALAPAFYSLGWIVGAVLLAPSIGIYGLAWGVVLGAALHLAAQIPALLRLRPEYHLRLGLKDPGVREVGSLIPPRLLGVAVVQVNFLVNTVIATSQPAGSLTAITMAFVVMLMPQVLIAQSMAIASMPTFSAQVALGRMDEMRGSLARTLRGVVFLSLPASLGLILLRKPIVSLLFERGAFDARSTELVAWALLWYAAGLVGHSLLEVVSRAFYALHDTRTPAFVGTAAMSLNIVLSLAFSALFARIGWAPHGGLALANSAATALEVAVLILLIRRRLGGLGKDLVRGVGRAVVAAGMMSLVLAGWLGLTGRISPWVTGPVGVLVGGGVYWLAAMVLRVPETRELPASFVHRDASQPPDSVR